MDILKTERLTLRAAREADIAPLCEAVLGDAEVMRHAFAGAAMARADAEGFIRTRFNFSGGPVGMGTLVETASGQVIGFAGLNPCDALGADDVELGFMLARAAWGKGFAREIGTAQMELGFRALKRSRVLALASPDNIGSVAVLTRLGMTAVRDVMTGERGLRRVFVGYARHPVAE